MNIALKLYLLSRAEKHVAGLLEDIKEDLKKNPTALEEANNYGLVVKLSVANGKRSFDLKKAEQVLTHKLPKTQLLADFTRIKLIPRGQVTQEMKDYLSQNFIVEEYLDVTEAKVAASTLDKKDIESCYKQAEPSLKITLPTKISTKDLLAMAESQSADFTGLYLEV